MTQTTRLVNLGFAVADSPILSMSYGQAAVIEHIGHRTVLWRDDWNVGHGWHPPDGTAIDPSLNSDWPRTDACLKLRVIDDNTDQLVDVLHVDVIAFRWQVAHHVFSRDDRDDSSYEVVDSEWLAELQGSNELGDAVYRHFTTNFNETWGTLEVVCQGVIVQAVGRR